MLRLLRMGCGEGVAEGSRLGKMVVGLRGHDGDGAFGRASGARMIDFI